jgi:hypothetical protein
MQSHTKSGSNIAQSGSNNQCEGVSRSVFCSNSQERHSANAYTILKTTASLSCVRTNTANAIRVVSKVLYLFLVSPVYLHTKQVNWFKDQSEYFPL